MENTISAQASNSDAPTLTGADLMGRIYNVRNGRIARSTSVKTTQLFDFSDETHAVEIGSLGEFYVSNDLLVDVNFDTHMGETTSEVFYSEDVNNSFSVNVGVSGSTGSFSGEMSECYSQTTENYYESSMALAKQFSQYSIYKLMMKGDAEYWRSLMLSSVNADINGTMPASDVVSKYGTHFLASGYFGGVWMYAQSISKYTSTSKIDVTNTLSASAEYEGVAIDSSTTNESSTTTTESTSQTELFLNTIGGTTTSSYDAWQASVNEGNWNLVAFDNVTNVSLQPLSVLVDPSNQARIDEINAAIKAVLTPYTFQTLYWESDGSRETINSGTIEKSFILNPETESQKVIVGIGLSVDDSNVSELTVKLLDMLTGTSDWYTQNSDGTHKLVYSDTTETETVCDNGFVVTGVGLNAGDHEMYQSVLYGQAFDVMDIDKNNYLGTQIYAFGKSDAETTYKPSTGNDRIITGIEIGVYKGDVGALYLYFGKFGKTAV